MENLLRDMTFSRLGLSPEEGELAVKVASELRRQYGETEIRRAAGLVKTAFESIRRTDSPVYHVFRGLYLNPTVDEQSVKLASLAYICIGRAAERTEKVAGGAAVGAGVKRMLGSVSLPTLLGDAIKTFGMAGGLAGVPVGGAAWLMRRGMTGQDKKLRELEIQRDTYGRLAAEVEQEMKRRNLANTPENVAATVEYLT